MKRLSEKNINTPEFFDQKFEEYMQKRGLQYCDMDRFDLMIKDFRGGKFLDLGALNSPVCIELKKKFPKSEFWILDFSPKTIYWWKENYPEINSVIANVSKTPFKDEYFDYIIAGELIEHIDLIEPFLNEVFRILKKGGIFVLSTPLKEEIRSRIAPEHVWRFEEEDIKKLLELYGETKIHIHTHTWPMIIAWCKKIGLQYIENGYLGYKRK